MEGCFVKEKNGLARVEAERYLRAYRRLNGISRSSRAYSRISLDHDCTDEAAIHAIMYSIRALILSIEDARERMFLYYYYVKGCTVEKCAEVLDISLRTAYRLKNSALESAAKKMKKADLRE